MAVTVSDHSPPTAPPVRTAVPPPWRRLALTAVVVTAIGVGLFVIGYNPPAARLAAVAPADGEALDRPPGNVAFEFTGGTGPQQIHVAVADADGGLLDTGAPTYTGRAVVIPVTIAAAGTYLLGYHILLGDGSQASGVTRFTVTGGGTAVRAAPDARTLTDLANATLVAATNGHQHASHDLLWRRIVGVNILLVVGVVVVTVRRSALTRSG